MDGNKVPPHFISIYVLWRYWGVEVFLSHFIAEHSPFHRALVHDPKVTLVIDKYWLRKRR